MNPNTRPAQPTRAPSVRRIGVLGGTFDPPHLGHILIAERALEYLGLDQVLFVPTRTPPHKEVEDVTPIEHRLEMVRRAIAPFSKFVLSRVDIDREGPTYTVDTIRLLWDQYEKGVEFYFIMGMDSLGNLLTWREPQKLIRQTRLVVFNRPGFDPDMAALEKSLPGLGERVIVIPAPAVDISATDLQRRVRAGEPFAHLVPEPVAAYIREHRLYNSKSPTVPR